MRPAIINPTMRKISGDQAVRSCNGRWIQSLLTDHGKEVLGLAEPAVKGSVSLTHLHGSGYSHAPDSHVVDSGAEHDQHGQPASLVSDREA